MRANTQAGEMNEKGMIVEIWPAECEGCCGSYCRNQKLMQYVNPTLGTVQLMGFKCLIEIADANGWRVQ